MKLQSFLFCLLLAIGANSFTIVKSQADNNDSLAIIDLYNSTNGANWTSHDNWLTDAPLRSWFGLKVKNNRVTEIELQNNHLAGSIPTSIGNLAKLEFLSLRINSLNGSIPSTIGNLTNLYYISLRDNKLSGPIPFSIGKLTNLQYLFLYNNRLTGGIPGSIGNLVKMLRLWLYGNPLGGTIPPSIGKLVDLQELYLYNNQLSGTIPSAIGSLTNLLDLQMQQNQLTGNIPVSIGNLSKLQYLWLNNNQLSGSIPAAVGNLSNLQYCTMSDNQLTGSIPYALGNLVRLSSLELGGNKLTGSVPLSFRNLHLYSLNLSYNQLSQPANTPFPMIDLQPAYVYVNNNNNTFNGFEFLAKNFPNAVYNHQAIVPIQRQGNTLSVYAGGTLSNNTYRWFKEGSAGVVVIKGDSAFHPAQDGKYYVKVTNAIATRLTLYSDTVDFTMSNLIANNRLAAVTSRSGKQFFQISPNPAGNIVHVRLNGTTTIILTNSTGKVVLSKTFTGNGAINVESLANGVYLIQNKATGEAQKIVVSH